MRWLVIAMLGMLLIPASAQAIIVSPNHFTATLPHGGNYSNHFRITPENISVQVDISWSSPFNITTSAKNLTLDTYYDMDFNLTIPELFLGGDYQSYIFVHGENDTKIVTIDITVENQEAYTSSNSVNITADAGDTGIFFLYLENTGNDIIELEFETSSGIGEVNTPADDIELYPGIGFEFPFTYTIDEDVLPDTYGATISIQHENNTRTIPIEFKISDGEPPVIEEVGIVNVDRDIEAGLRQTFWARCSDNIEVDRMTIGIISEDFNDTFAMGFEGDKFEFEKELEFVGDTEFIFTCEDIHGNTAQNIMEREVIQILGCEVNDIEFYSIKRDTTVSKRILDCEHEIPVTVSLRDFEYNPDTDANSSDFTFFIDDGVRRNTFVGENNSYEFEEVDILKVALEANNSGFYSGKINLDFPEWIHDDVTLEFDGRVGQMTVPEYHNTSIGTTALNCKAHFTDDETSSKWICSVEYPITTSLDSLGVPMTPRRYQEIESTCNSKIFLKDETITNYASTNSLLILLIILFVVYLVVSYIIPNISHNRNRPRVLFKLR